MRGFSSVTHTVFNQSSPLENINLYTADPVLSSSEFILETHRDRLHKYGELCGTAANMKHATLAEKNKPTLRQFDSYGRRIDVIDYHDSYHHLMQQGLRNGVSAFGHATAEAGSHVARAGLIYMENQLEPGHCCPLVMTTAAVPPLLKWGRTDLVDKLCTMDYDPRDVPIEEKVAITAGMSMTEKQGGSDVRANTTLATPLDPARTGHDASYTLRGHKWFTSAPMSDIFLTLAMTRGKDTPSCFIVSRWLPDGTRNTGFRVMRLKDKVGDRANASSEVEYDDAHAVMLGEEGRGVKTIIEMVQSTRLDCVLGSAGGARRALQQALNHVTHRKSFGSPLIAHPLMENLLTDLCVESEAHTLTALHLAGAYDSSLHHRNIPAAFLTSGAGPMVEKLKHTDTEYTEAQELFRIGVAVGKYWVTKRYPGFAYECMEAFGGNGYVEDFNMGMLYRQSPLNAIWEGSGNIIALDVLRAHKSFPVLLRDIKLACGMDPSLDEFISDIEKRVSRAASENIMSPMIQREARRLVDMLALAMQASVMARYGDPTVAEAYIASRIKRDRLNSGLNYGSFVYPSDMSKCIIERNTSGLIK